MHRYLISFNYATDSIFGFSNRIVMLPKPPTPEQIREYEAELSRQHPARPADVVALSVSLLGD